MKSEKKCVRGLGCGYTCISKLKVCRQAFGSVVSDAANRAVDVIASISKAVGSHNDFQTVDYENQKATQAEIAQKLQVSSTEAFTMLESVLGWTGDPGDTKSSELKGKPNEQTKALNDFIDKAPKYNGSIHRGLYLNNESLDAFLDSIKDGMVLKHTSSFSSSESVAKEFAVKDSKNGAVGVVLTVKKNSSGVSVKPFSFFPEEDEVIAPTGTKYKVSKITQQTQQGKNSYYEVELVEDAPEKQQARRSDVYKQNRKSK